MRRVRDIISGGISIMAALLLAFSIGACGSEEKTVPDPGSDEGTASKSTLEELNEKEQKAIMNAYAEAADERINAENAEEIAEKLAQEIEADQ